MGHGGIAPAQVNKYTSFTDSPTYFSSLMTQIEWLPCFIPFLYTDTNAAFAVTVLFTFSSAMPVSTPGRQGFGP